MDWRINVSPFNQGPGEIRGLFLLYNTDKVDKPPLAEDVRTRGESAGRKIQRPRARG